MLLVNLRMDAGYVREGMNINWKGEVRNYFDRGHPWIGGITSYNRCVMEIFSTFAFRPV